jgi:hypothetical protein
MNVARLFSFTWNRARPQGFLTSSQAQRQPCTNTEVNVTFGVKWRTDGVSNLATSSVRATTVPMASNGALLGPQARQQVLGVRENVVDTRGCNDIEQSAATNYDAIKGWPTDPSSAINDAERVATAMLDNVTN